MGEILDASKSISEKEKQQREDAAEKAKQAAEIANQRQSELTLLDAELAILNAQNDGQREKAQQMQRNLDIAQETLRIMEATGLSEEEAVRRARDLVDARNKAAGVGQERDRKIIGYKPIGPGDEDAARSRAVERSRDSLARREERMREAFGGLDEWKKRQGKSLATEFRFSGLDAYQQLQDRSRPVGAPMPAAQNKGSQTQELPSVEQLLRQLILTTQNLGES